jgi:signal transduction histidine kinase
MSHEIRTPMNAIVGFSSLIEDEKDQTTRAQYVDIIQNSSDNLLKLINDIIELSKIETSDFQLIYEGFTIDQLFTAVKQIILIEQKKHKRTGIKIIYDNKVANKTIISDPRRIQQLLINLIVNALKFTEKGSVIIDAKLNNNLLQFTVTDTGIGIKPEDLPKIFDRFVKFDHHGSNKEGSGIGLTLVQHIVEVLKGEITVESKENSGSTFIVSFPVSNDSH